jgi:2,4-dienoyl-CoA reductase-like NADH-dependent reductase (Old Yellow Enzyme family)
MVEMDTFSCKCFSSFRFRRSSLTSHLFSPLILSGVSFRNRIFVSPMCQYSATDGLPNEWHFVHLGSRAVGGAACIIQEATAVAPEGRITPSDLGIWNDSQMEAYRPLTRFLKENGAVPAVQLAHAGRKASTSAPWQGGRALELGQGGWTVVAPSPVPFDAQSPMPHELSEGEIAGIVTSFTKAAERSLSAGFEVIELHAAHGYLLHQFLSPLSNRRTDRYGGRLENRLRLVLDVASAVRDVWPEELPLFVRLSATDWKEGGWDVPQSIALCVKLKDIGVDFIDVSSAGLVPDAKVVIGPGYQVPFASAIRNQAHISTGAVGMITDAAQAEKIVSDGHADVVLLARELLRDPYWPQHAAHALGDDLSWPPQYERAKLRF